MGIIQENGGVFMRKIKVLITLFVIMLILSTDLGTFFSGNAGKEQVAETTETMGTAEDGNENIFQFDYLQHNLGCITNAIQSAITSKTKSATSNLADKYTNAIADATTKSVEKAITEKETKMNTAKVEKTSNTKAE